MECLCYHGKITKQAEEELFKKHGRTGSYLIRDSESRSNMYTLTLYNGNRMIYYRIQKDNDGLFYFNNDEKFTTLSYLIHRYVDLGSNNGLACEMLHAIEKPKNAEQEEQGAYEIIRDMTSNKSPNPLYHDHKQTNAIAAHYGDPEVISEKQEPPARPPLPKRGEPSSSTSTHVRIKSVPSTQYEHLPEKTEREDSNPYEPMETDYSGQGGLKSVTPSADRELCPEACRIREMLKEGSFLVERRENNPVNIMLVGLTGVGKSSLTNSLLMSINPRGYMELSKRGYFGEGGKDDKAAVTTSFEPCNMFRLFPKNSEEHSFAAHPVIWDTPGFQDEYDERFATIIRLIINGRMEPGQKIRDLIGTENKSNFKRSLKKRRADEMSKIHIVIYVHAVTDPIPEGLTKCLREALHSEKEGEITIHPFVVITKMDVMCEKNRRHLPKIKREIAEHLGIGGLEERIFETSLYCSKISPKLTRVQEIDAVMCQIWEKILKPENMFLSETKKGWLTSKIGETGTLLSKLRHKDKYTTM